MPEKQEMRVGMGAASGSKSKYELEGWGIPPHDRLWRARGEGRGLAPPFPTAAWGIMKPHARMAVGANEAPPVQPHPQWLFTSIFSFPSGISKPTVRATSGTPSWVSRGFPTLTVLEGMEAVLE